MSRRGGNFHVSLKTRTFLCDGGSRSEAREERSVPLAVGTRWIGWVCLVNQIIRLPAAQFFAFPSLNSRPLQESCLIVSSFCGADDFSCGCSEAQRDRDRGTSGDVAGLGSPFLSPWRCSLPPPPLRGCISSYYGRCLFLCSIWAS